MDVPKEVIKRPTIPTDLHEKFNYNADRLVATAVTQTYSYMLESGVEYSCITTGEAIVFLWIKEDDSQTLYYHLAELQRYSKNWYELVCIGLVAESKSTYESYFRCVPRQAQP